MSRLRREEGFTLPELITTLVMLMIITLAAFALLETAMRRTSDTQARVEANQRGRQALDIITRQLRSQTCIPEDQSTTALAQPAISVADPNSVTFFVDLSTGNADFDDRIEKRVLTYNPTAKTITETRYLTTGVVPVVFRATPESTRVLLSNVVPDPTNKNSANVVSVFRYFAFGPGSAGVAPKTDVELVSPAAADIGRVALVDLAFVTRAGAATAAPTTIPAGSLTLHDQVYVRAADPNDPAPYPTCV